MKKVLLCLKWAVIFNLLLLLWNFIQKSLGILDADVSNYGKYSFVLMIPALFIYYFALKEIEKKCYKNNMNFRQSVTNGIILTLFCVLFTIPIVIISCTLIAPDFLDTLRIYAVKNGDIQPEQAAKYYTLPVFLISNCIYGLFLGLMTTFITASYLRYQSQNNNN